MLLELERPDGHSFHRKARTQVEVQAAVWQHAHKVAIRFLGHLRPRKEHPMGRGK